MTRYMFKGTAAELIRLSPEPMATAVAILLGSMVSSGIKEITVGPEIVDKTVDIRVEVKGEGSALTFKIVEDEQ